MSKFLNTQRRDTISFLVDGVKAKLDNPYYINTDTNTTVVDYYNQNIDQSTLDEGSKTTYSNLGSNSSIMYNKINGMFMMGLGRIAINLDNGDFGLESDSIEGEATILPNTIIPYPNDYFNIRHTDNNILFKVLSVTFDTIDDGANVYKVQYKLDQITNDHIEKQIVEQYEFVPNNTGTSFNPIIQSTQYKTIESLENMSYTLVKYYKELFFNNRVQTFTFKYNDNYFYDPYMIEFMIRNNILSKDDEFLYVTHQTIIPATFSIDYDKTFFRYVEVNDRNKFTPKISSQATIITNPLSSLSSRLEDYFEISYRYPSNTVKVTIQNYESELLDRIKMNRQYSSVDCDIYNNIIIKHFNNLDIYEDDLVYLDNIDYEPNIKLFYNIPIIIYAINTQIEKMLKK